MLFFSFCVQRTGAENPLDLSKRLDKESLENPLDLSQKTATMNEQEDRKPCHVLYRTLRYITPTSPPSTESKWNVRSSVVNPRLSASATNMQQTVSTALVQKVSPVQLQTYSCTDSPTKTCVIAAAQRFIPFERLSECYSSDHTGRVKGRNISVVKPAACSISDTRLLAMSVEPTVTGNSSLYALQPSQSIHTNQKASPRYTLVAPTSFDTGRTDRGLPLAQVYPSRVVMSTTQNRPAETVPSPLHCNEELLQKSSSNKTQLLDKNFATVSAVSASSFNRTPSHVATVAALPVLASLDNGNTVKSPVSVSSTTSIEVTPPMPILSPNIPGGCFINHAEPSAVSPESCLAKSSSSKSILPPVENSPISLSDRDSFPDEDDSGHELFSTHMDWDDNVPDRKDFYSDDSPTEDSSVKQPAFEVVNDCNRALMRDIAAPCYVAAAFDRSLLQSESDLRDYIARTKYYRFFSRKCHAVGSGPHDVDVVQSDTCSSPSMPCSTPQELRLPVRLFSALKGSPALTKESDCKHGILDKKMRKLHHQKLRRDLVDYDIIGTVYSQTPNNRPKGGSRVAYSDSLVQVKLEVTEDSADPASRPDALTRNVCRRRKKNVPTETQAGASDSFDEIVGSTNEMNSIVNEGDRESCRSAGSVDVTSTGFDHMKYVSSDLADACGESVSRVHSDLTTVSESSSNKGCIKRDPQAESAAERKTPCRKVPGVRQRRPGDANNNQGKTTDDLAASTSVTSVNEAEHFGNTRRLRKTETSSADGPQQSSKLSVHTRASTTSSKCDVTVATYRRCRMTSAVSKSQQIGLDSKPKESSRSADGAVSLSSSKSDETVSKQTSITSGTSQERFRSFRQLNKCTTERSIAKAKNSKSNGAVAASDVSDSQSKAQRSILRQLESSEGYIAEKNTKYSRSEDLFDDSSLLSREQRALRVSNVLLVKTDIIIVNSC